MKTITSVVNGQSLPLLFQVGGKHQIWQEDTYRSGEFNLIGSCVKIDVRAISGPRFCQYIPGDFGGNAHRGTR